MNETQKHPILLLSALIMPHEGTFECKKITRGQYAVVYNTATKIESTVGYPNTARFIERITGAKEGAVEVSRTKCTFEIGQVGLVAKLKYRLRDPNEKRTYVPKDEDYDFFKICRIG